MKQADAPEGRRPQDVIDARNRWIRVLSALETALAISGADDETVARILSPLQDAEAKAARRKATAGRGAVPDGSPPAKDEDQTVNGG
jgi:hypothetical protein